MGAKRWRPTRSSIFTEKILTNHEDCATIYSIVNYSVDFDISLVKERTIEQWVLRWCRKYHPEAFEQAEEFIKTLIKDNEDK